MAAIGGNQGEGPRKPPSKEDVIAMLKAFQDQIDAGGGQNEEGDDFIDIQEEWDAEGNVIRAVGNGGGGGGPSMIEEEADDESLEEELLAEEEEEVDFDEDAFESMMQEMENLELAAAEEEQNRAAAAAAKSPSGMKKGFLLPRGEQKASTKPTISTTSKETTASPATAASNTSKITKNRPTAFTGAVVERQVGETAPPSRSLPATSTTSTTSSSKTEGQQGEPQPPPQRVSKFKQRMYGQGSYM